MVDGKICAQILRNALFSEHPLNRDLQWLAGGSACLVLGWICSTILTPRLCNTGTVKPKISVDLSFIAKTFSTEAEH